MAEAAFYPNPYEFVPLENGNQPRSGWKAAEDGLECWQPERYSGRLHCRLHPETPLFLHGEGQQGREQRQFVRLGGRPGIPASSLKGALRSIYEIVSDSCLSALSEKYQAPRSHIRTYSNPRLSEEEYDRLHPIYRPETQVPKRYLPCATLDEACPACLLFGMVEQKEEGTPLAGRLRLSDGVSVRTNRLAVTIPAAGGGPHPWHSSFYFADEGQGQILGRKLYFHHRDYQATLRAYGGNPNRPTSLIELDAQIGDFAFQVDFFNLQEAELAYLVYTLVLEPGIRHHLGYGKPYGLGSASMAVERLEFTHTPGRKGIERFRTFHAAPTELGNGAEWAEKGRTLWQARPNGQVAQAALARILAWPGVAIYKYPDFRWFRNTQDSGRVTLAQYQQDYGKARLAELQQERRRNDVPAGNVVAAPAASMRLQGTVKQFDSQRKFGFIAVAGRRRELFVHVNNVQGKRDLTAGDLVEFEEGPGRKPGETEAKNVRLLGQGGRA